MSNAPVGEDFYEITTCAGGGGGLVGEYIDKCITEVKCMPFSAKLINEIMIILYK